MVRCVFVIMRCCIKCDNVVMIIMMWHLYRAFLMRFTTLDM